MSESKRVREQERVTLREAKREKASAPMQQGRAAAGPREQLLASLAVPDAACAAACCAPRLHLWSVPAALTRRRAATATNDNAGEGVTGLRELGTREMSYKLMFVACSATVRAARIEDAASRERMRALLRLRRGRQVPCMLVSVSLSLPLPLCLFHRAQAPSLNPRSPAVLQRARRCRQHPPRRRRGAREGKGQPFDAAAAAVASFASVAVRCCCR